MNYDLLVIKIGRDRLKDFTSYKYYFVL